MNVAQNINKLLYALKQKGLLYKINSFQIYSEKNDKFFTKYQIQKREQIEVYNRDIEKTEIQQRYIVKKEYYSKIDVMKYLAEEYKKGSEANEWRVWQINRKTKKVYRLLYRNSKRKRQCNNGGI